jgi:hypothetical protein
VRALPFFSAADSAAARLPTIARALPVQLDAQLLDLLRDHLLDLFHQLLAKFAERPADHLVDVWLPGRRQLVEATQDERLPPIRMLDVVDAQIGQAAEQRVDRNLAFEAGELRPNAVVDAAAE